MQTYAEVLTYAIPFFILLILIEYLISRYKGMEVINSFDTVSSLSSGLTNSIKDVLGLAIIIVSYSWMVERLAVFAIENTILIYLLAFIGLDFAGYWSHRFEHEINLLWNRHIIHHSSEEFNLACALRQNVSAIFGLFFFLFLPMAVLGVPAKVVAIVAPLHLFAQFWYHTRVINKMGFLEYIIVTPSHHRVHHAINNEYLDKNFGQIFIFWDKWFGTFQEELDDIPPVYGVKRQVNTWNPLLINFQHLWLLLKDAWYTKSWGDKLKVFIKPTGWRPADRELQEPVAYIDKAETQVKYKTAGSIFLKLWIWGQLIIHIALMLFMFNQLDAVSFQYILFYGMFLYVSIFSYTSMMDRVKWAIPLELLKVVFGLILIYLLGGWFNLESIIPFATYLIIGYLFISLMLNSYFILNEPLVQVRS